MATKRKKSGTARRASSRKKKRASGNFTASLAMLCAGVLLEIMAFMPGRALWLGLHNLLFGLFGCGSYLLGVALCWLAVLLARGEDLWGPIFKTALTLLFVSGTAVVFSGVEAEGASLAQLAAACWQNGQQALVGGGALGLVFGGSLLALCGRPAANVIVVVLAVCAALYVLGISAADLWQYLGLATVAARDKGAAAYESSRVRHAERRAASEQARAARQQQLAQQQQERQERQQQQQQQQPARGPAEWLGSILGRGRLPGANEPAGADPLADVPPISDDVGYEPPPPGPAARAGGAKPDRTPARAPFDIDLGPDTTVVSAGGSEGVEPAEIGPGGTFGMNPLAPAQPAAHSAAAQEGAQPAAPVPPAKEAEQAAQPAPEAQPAAEPAAQEEDFFVPVAPAAPRVSAENAVALRSEPDEDGWIRIDAEPMDAADIDSLVATAMVKPQAAEQAAAAAPAEPQPEPQPQAVPYRCPPVGLFDTADGSEDEAGVQAELTANAQKLVETLESFGVKTRVLDISRGPAVTRYELQPMAGVKISKITALADDIALNLAVAGVRIEAPIPGKPAVGIEVPNRKRQTVSIRSIFESQAFARMASPLTIALGKDIAGVAQVGDLCKMPHLLIAGTTGSGKSVCVNSIIMSLLYRCSPEEVKMILIDPKVVELAEYNGIPHLLMPVVTEPRKAAGALASAVGEMERRYHLFADNNVRDIKTFNRLAQQDPMLEQLPYIVIVIDELADLMMVAGKDVEDSICRIAQKARAAGMHLIVATQRPSVDVITGLIKANIPSRIAFAVSNQVDSRTILDSAGAEKLLGFGDMLYMPVGAPKPTRMQGTFVKDEEITRVLGFIKQDNGAQYDEAMIANMEKHAVQEKGGGKNGAAAEEDAAEAGDPMLDQAVEVVIDAGQASTSLLQRRCKLGYARAARIMDEMEQRGIIGPYEGAKPRAVLISRQQWLEMNLNKSDG